MRRLATLSLLALAACAGYNANYKANRYAADARKLDAEGRGVEAGGYWNRAFVKAESILARNPNGRYAANANAIRGEAFAALGQCPAAARVLPGAIETIKSQDTREQATIALGLCEIALGTPALAITTVTPVTESKNAGRRRLALLVLGTAQRQVGDYPAALASLKDLPGVIPQAQRLYAYAGLHDSVAAHATFDSLLALRDSTLPWDSLFTVTGRADPLIASSLLDQLSAAKLLSLDRIDALAFADAVRLGTVNRAEQRMEYVDIIHRGGNQALVDRARLELLYLDVQGAQQVPQLLAVRDSLEVLQGAEPAVAAQAQVLHGQMDKLSRVMDSTAPGEPKGDMRLFLAAEFARDSLQAPALAATLFDSIPAGWPESPYAAKAWLAGRQLSGDTMDAGGRFTSSAYMQALRGESGEAYAQLEDSLATFARQLAASSKAAARPAAKRTDLVSPDEDDASVRRRPQRAKQQQPGSKRSTTTSTAPPEERRGAGRGTPHHLPEPDPPRRRHCRLRA